MSTRISSSAQGLAPPLLLAACAHAGTARAASTPRDTVGFEAGYRRDHLVERAGHGFGLGVSGDRLLAERWRGSLRLSFLYLTLDNQYSPLVVVPFQIGISALLGPYVWAGIEAGPTVWSADKLVLDKRAWSIGASLEPTLGVRISSLEVRLGVNLHYHPQAAAVVSGISLGWRFGQSSSTP